MLQKRYTVVTSSFFRCLISPAAHCSLVLLCCSSGTCLSYTSLQTLGKGHSSCSCCSSIQQNRALHRPSGAATGLALPSRLSHLPTCMRCQLPWQILLKWHLGEMWLKLNSPEYRQPVAPWMLHRILLAVSGQCQCLYVLCHSCQPCAHTQGNLGVLKWYKTLRLCKVGSPSPQMLSYILFNSTALL